MSDKIRRCCATCHRGPSDRCALIGKCGHAYGYAMWEPKVESAEPLPRSTTTVTAAESPVNQDSGTKHDADKPRWDLLPYDAVAGTVDVLTFGAKKYADRNWEKGIAYGRVFGAMQRHMTAWWSGEDNDPETGLSHLDHAACCVAFLQAFVKRGRSDLDDRPTNNKEAA